MILAVDVYLYAPFLDSLLGFIDAGFVAAVARVFLEFILRDEPEEP